MKATGAEASIAFVPPPFAADALMEAADAGLRLVCIITDGIPAQDMMRVKRYLRRYPKERRTTLVGPNCAGIISAGKAMLGIMPSNIYIPGSVGVVSRSGTLGYEAGAQMKALGIGITTSVGIGGDPINGSSFLDHLMLFEEDPETEAVIMIGEIGGPQEAEAAKWVKENMTKPVVGYVAGVTAPKGRRMGHAGAIISAEGDTAAEKSEIMKSYGLLSRQARPSSARPSPARCDGGLSPCAAWIGAIGNGRGAGPTGRTLEHPALTTRSGRALTRGTRQLLARRTPLRSPGRRVGTLCAGRREQCCARNERVPNCRQRCCARPAGAGNLVPAPCDR